MLAELVEGGLIGVGFGVREVEVAHAIDRHDMDVHVGHLEPGDHEPDTGGVEECFLRLTDAVGDGHEVGSGGSIEIGPLVDLDTGYDEDVAVSKGTHVEEGDTDVVGPDEASRDLAGDDAGEDGRHAGIVGCGP